MNHTNARRNFGESVVPVPAFRRERNIRHQVSQSWSMLGHWVRDTCRVLEPLRASSQRTDSFWLVLYPHSCWQYTTHPSIVFGDVPLSHRHPPSLCSHGVARSCDATRAGDQWGKSQEVGGPGRIRRVTVLICTDAGKSPCSNICKYIKYAQLEKRIHMENCPLPLPGFPANRPLCVGENRIPQPNGLSLSWHIMIITFPFWK